MDRGRTRLQKELASQKPTTKETEMVFLTSHQKSAEDEAYHEDPGDAVFDIPHATVFPDPVQQPEEEKPKA